MNTKTKLLSALIGAGIITTATLTYAARPWYSCLSPKHIKTTKAECFASCTSEQRVWNEADETCDPVSSGFECPIKCYGDEGYSYCDGGIWADVCFADPSVCCTPPEEGKTRCATNSDCLANEYCNYIGNFGYGQTPGAVGTCMTISESTVDSSGGLVQGNYMDWYSAKNFCARAAGGLVSLDEACPDGWSYRSFCSGNIIKSGVGYWTADEYNSSYASYVYYDGNVDYGNKYYYNYALCK